MTLAGLILGLVTLQRLGELALSKRNADDHAVGFPCPSSRGRSSSRAISKWIATNTVRSQKPLSPPRLPMIRDAGYRFLVRRAKASKHASNCGMGF
jgi:hypothetical protein